MDSILVGIICGFANAARGQAGLKLEFWKLSISARIVAALICASAIGLATDSSGLEAVILAACVFLMLVFGWGKYFMVGHGINMRFQREFWPADKIADWINPKSHYVYGFIGMAVRWWIPSIPLLYFTTGWHGVILSPLFGCLVASWYWFAGLLGRKAGLINWVRLAELTSGAMLGVLV